MSGTTVNRLIEVSSGFSFRMYSLIQLGSYPGRRSMYQLQIVVWIAKTEIFGTVSKADRIAILQVSDTEAF